MGQEVEKGGKTYSLLDIVDGEASRESGRSGESGGRRDDFRAVDHVVDIVSEDGEFQHGSLECALEFALVVC